MKSVVRIMRDLYRIRKYDFMGYNFRTIDELSFHHIVKRSQGGSDDISNGALLNRETSHPYLHIIENVDYRTYVDINKILKEINSQKSQPTKEQLERIRNLLLEFESQYKDVESSRGKKLLRKVYLEKRVDLDDI